MTQCINCTNETSNPKFCSRSCSTSYNNSKLPKRGAKPWFCIVCGDITKYRNKYCDLCRPGRINWTTISVRDLQSKPKYQVSAYIRDNSRRIYRNSKRPKRCSICNYDKHYEVCHITPISAYPVDTPISLVNSLENLIALCPNCHWELDNGLLNL